jgi:hypothetical protein
MPHTSRLTLKRRFVAAALCAAFLGGMAAPALAADLAPLEGARVTHVKRVWHTRIDVNWRDRCAFAGYYCLYAEYGHVFAYPFDDRPVARGRRRLR